MADRRANHPLIEHLGRTKDGAMEMFFRHAQQMGLVKYSIDFSTPKDFQASRHSTPGSNIQQPAALRQVVFPADAGTELAWARENRRAAGLDKAGDGGAAHGLTKAPR